jgi:hypothetical protein
MVETGIDLWSFCVDVDKTLVKSHRKMGKLSKNHQNITGICLFIRCLLSAQSTTKKTCIDMILSPQKIGYSRYLWDCFARMYPNDWSRNLPFILLNENIEQMKEQEDLFVALCANAKSLCYLESCAVNLNMRVLTQLILLARLVMELEIWLDVKAIQDLFPMDLKFLNWNNWQRVLMSKVPQVSTIRMLFDQVYNNAQKNVSIFPNFMFALRVSRGKAIPVSVDDTRIISDNSGAVMSQNIIDTTNDDFLIFIMTSVQNVAKLQTDENASLLQFEYGYEFDGFVAWRFNASSRDNCSISDLVSYFTSSDKYSQIPKNTMTAHIVKVSKTDFETFQKTKRQEQEKHQQDQQQQQRERIFKKKLQKSLKRIEWKEMQKIVKNRQMKSSENWVSFITCLGSCWKVIVRRKMRFKEFIAKCRNFIKRAPIIKSSMALQRATIHGCFKVIAFILGELDAIQCFDVPEHSYELQTDYAFNFAMNLEFLVRPNMHDFIYRSDLGKNLIHCDHIALVAEYAEEEKIYSSPRIVSNMIMERCRILLKSKFPASLGKLLKHHTEFKHLSSIVDIFQLLNINIKAFLRLFEEDSLVFIRNLDFIYSDVIELNEKHVEPWQTSCKTKNVWRLLVNPLPQSVLLKWIYTQEPKTTLFKILGFEKDIGFSCKGLFR